MLVDLTFDIAEVERRKQICKEHNINEKYLCTHPDNHIETGVYRCGCNFNFGKDEFVELKNLTYDDECYSMVKEWFTSKTGLKFPVDMLEQYGVADNIEQIKEYYKEWIKKSNWVITITPTPLKFVLLDISIEKACLSTRIKSLTLTTIQRVSSTQVGLTNLEKSPTMIL